MKVHDEENDITNTLNYIIITRNLEGKHPLNNRRRF